MLPLQGTGVRSLVRGVRSCTLHNIAKKERKKASSESWPHPAELTVSPSQESQCSSNSFLNKLSRDRIPWSESEDALCIPAWAPGTLLQSDRNRMANLPQFAWDFRSLLLKVSHPERPLSPRQTEMVGHLGQEMREVQWVLQRLPLYCSTTVEQGVHLWDLLLPSGCMARAFMSTGTEGRVSKRIHLNVVLLLWTEMCVCVHMPCASVCINMHTQICVKKIFK